MATKKRKPREWWVVLGPPPMNGRFVYSREVIALGAARPCNAEVVHVREVLEDRATCSCGTPLEDCYPEDDDGKG